METIRELRKKKGLTQQQLADLIGISNVSLSNYERGTQMPDLVTLANIAKELDTTTDLLLGLASEIPESEKPRTIEARILAEGIDRLPKEQREQALDVMRAVFASHADYFKKGKEEDDT